MFDFEDCSRFRGLMGRKVEPYDSVVDNTLLRHAIMPFAYHAIMNRLVSDGGSGTISPTTLNFALNGLSS